LPAMNCAVDAAAHVMAMTTAEAGCGVEVLIRVVQPRPVGA